MKIFKHVGYKVVIAVTMRTAVWSDGSSFDLISQPEDEGNACTHNDDKLLSNYMPSYTKIYSTLI